MSETTANVFDIEKFAVHDGPGIRTVVFVKGCPLRCKWCHNPESQAFDPEVLYSSAKCVACGRCAAVCPSGAHTVANGSHNFDRSLCTHCGRCAKACLSGALEFAGRPMTIEEVMGDVRRDKPFYDNSGGGLTVSGGEPLANFEFTSALLAAAKAEGIHTAIETSGFAPRERVEALLPLVDLWLWDVKAPPSRHKGLTGVEAGPILDNLAFIGSRGAKIVLRCPLIPGVNDDEEALRHIANLAATTPGVTKIDLEPYHPLGVDKARRLGRVQEEHPFPPRDYAQRVAAFLSTLERA